MKGRAGAGMVVVAAAAALGSTPGAARASGVEAERAYRAGKAAPSEEQSRQHYQRGVATARAALARDPDDPGAQLWYAANLAAEALTHGKLYTLRVIPEIERTLLRVEQRSPLFDNAAAARALGRLYHKAPAFISIGSNRKAGELLQRALARAPAFPGNQAFAAELYLDQRDCGRARPLAQKILATPDLGRYGPDAAEWLEIARAVMAACP